MFIDASALVAILSDERDGDALADTLDAARSPITSAVAIFEATLALCRKRHVSVREAHADVLDLLAAAAIEIRPISAETAAAALDAFARYGKGRGHPAQLNLGDCFAYAMASTQKTTLLFKGDDFNMTDIRPARSI